MSAKVALGFSTKNAFVAPTGKILVTDSIWTQNNQGGAYPGWGWNSTVNAKCETMLTAIMSWISSGKRYLVLDRSPQVDGDSFGSAFEAHVVASGGTLTRTGSSGRFNGYDWNNYDVICAAATNDTTEADTFDAAIVGGKAALVTVIPYSNKFARYGIDRAGYQSAYGGPNYLGYPFDCAPLGLVGHQLVAYSSQKLIAGTNTMGGTYTRYDNTLGESLVGIWTP